MRDRHLSIEDCCESMLITRVFWGGEGFVSRKSTADDAAEYPWKSNSVARQTQILGESMNGKSNKA